jgi:CubicO group peptidase (beta-lactamase class C family)
MLLNHQAGLAALRRPLPEGAFYDWEVMVGALEKEEPFWPPGTRNGYHALTFGWLVGEVVRRVSGKSLGTFFHDEVAGPLGLDFWIGLPDGRESRVAPMIPGEPDLESPFFKAMADPASLPALLFLIPRLSRSPRPRFAGGSWPRSGPRGYRQRRGLAGMYRRLRRKGLVSGTSLARMAMVIGDGRTPHLPTRLSLRVHGESLDNRRQPRAPRSVILPGRLRPSPAGRHRVCRPASGDVVRIR